MAPTKDEITQLIHKTQEKVDAKQFQIDEERRKNPRNTNQIEIWEKQNVNDRKLIEALEKKEDELAKLEA
ncbi:hypothetical protein FRC01_003158, partial [Tulasnella sp. 417]